MTTRRVLMISYWYPPTPGAGSLRTAGFAENLPEHGWHADVVTASDTDAAIDSASERPDPAPRIVGVRDMASPSRLFRPYAGDSGGSRGRDLLRWTVFPDRFLVWRLRATRIARRLAHDAPCDAIWATFPPASAAIVGESLARWTRRPLVLDLRDPWPGIGGHTAQLKPLRRRHAELERRILRQAAAIITVSDAMRDDLRWRLGIDPAIVHVIPNGWDQRRCGPIEVTPRAAAPHDVPVLAHVGTLTQRNRPDLLLESLRRTRDLHGRLPVRIRFVGNASPQWLGESGLADLIEHTALTSPARAWAETCSADALLLLVGDYVARWGHNAKLFEYLRAGRPILCLETTPDSNDARLLRRLAPDRCVVERLAADRDLFATLTDVASRAARTPRATLADSPELREFERGALAGRLARVLNALMHG